MFEGKKAAVVGLGVSGAAAAALLKEKGAEVRVTEAADSEEARGRAAALREARIECELGGHTEGFLEGVELLVVSPGVESGALPMKWAGARGVSVMSEVELAFRFCEGTIVAVSGTNGKSTVVTILGDIFRKAGRPAFVCGNIGTPFSSIVGSVKSGDAVVLEISSFQLERIESFRPHIAVMLNITEDHLDRYKDFNEYKEAKFRLFTNQGGSDYAITNYDQPRIKNIKGPGGARPLYFSKFRLPREYDGAYVENGELLVRMGGRYVWIANNTSVPLNGEHNVENALAAALAASLMGVDADTIREAVAAFKGLGHRFEFVDNINGVKFIDDSKATNIDSTRRAVQASTKGVILIAGGRDKGGDYRALSKLFKDKVKALVLIGEAGRRIADSLSSSTEVAFAGGMDEAVRLAFGRAKNGDTVLLSPMCSSFDMFRDYAERGEAFRRGVGGLKDKKKA